jgi:cysteine desulfurase
VNEEGFVDVAVLRDLLADDVLAVSIMAVNNEIGTIQDIGRLSEIIRESGALVHCDAAQAPCAMDLRSVSQLVDLLSLSGHKMYGPQGIGALFIRRDLQNRVEPLVYGGGQQRDLRSGTVPVALCVGMGAAAAIAASAAAVEERTQLRRQRDKFVRGIMALPWRVSVNGPDSAHRHPGNSNMRFDGFDARDILSTLQPDLAASMGSACTSGIPEPSHVLRAIGLSGNQAESSIRFSIGRNTKASDLDEAVTLIDDSLTRLASAEAGGP